MELEGDDWSFGLNAGVLWEPRPGTRLGLAYRQRVEHEIAGDASFLVPQRFQPLLPLTGNAFRATGATAELELPDTVAANIVQELGEVTLMGGVQWTDWQIERLDVDFANPAQPNSVEDLAYEDTFRYAVGATWAPAALDGWEFRAGAGYDESPSAPAFRSPRIPDQDRTLLSLGAGWSPLPQLSVDAASQLVLFDDSEVDRTGSSGDWLRAGYEADALIVTLGASWRF